MRQPLAAFAMNLEPPDLARLRGTFIQILPVADVASARFYEGLFERAPQVRILFSTNLDDLGEKFMMMLAVLLDNLAEPRRLARACRAQGALHVRFGVRDEHFGPVIDALLESFSATLGEWTEEDDRIWRALLAQITEWMKEGAHDASRTGLDGGVS